MTRIVAGSVGGRKLAVPMHGTRPTSERVREALFSHLEHRAVLAEAKVIDLYAGSGALGLEAASRGAATVQLVEKSAAAIKVIRSNIRALGLDNVSVHGMAVAKYLSQCQTSVDLLLADPPYDIDPDELAHMLTLTNAVLAPGGLLVLESSTRSPDPRWPACYRDITHRDYGETRIWLADKD